MLSVHRAQLCCNNEVCLVTVKLCLLFFIVSRCYAKNFQFLDSYNNHQQTQSAGIDHGMFNRFDTMPEYDTDGRHPSPS